MTKNGYDIISEMLGPISTVSDISNSAVEDSAINGPTRGKFVFGTAAKVARKILPGTKAVPKIQTNQPPQ